MRSAKGWGVLALLNASAVFAHHSAGMFDPSRTVTVKGTVTSFEWTNPHVWLWVHGQDASGTAQNWGIECANLAMLRRAGLRRDSVKPGDQVTVDIHPLKDGRFGGMFVKMTFPDGHVFDMTPTISNANVPTPGA